MISRRELITGGAALAVTAPALAHVRASANEKIVLAFMGVNNRGSDLAGGFVTLPNVEIAYICDVDDRAIAKGIGIVQKKQAKAPQGVKDFRRVLDDKSVDVLVIAAPDHWHAPATILACSAGKHVYVEKPACHNPREGELMVAVARKHNRVVQLGTQRRSMKAVKEAIERLRSGEIGRVTFSRGWYNNTRPSIGRGKTAPVPGWLDYNLWQGPAPEHEFHDNVVHYNWHWFWHWGTGELGNNGIHALDVCRWGLGVDYPKRVTAGGGRFTFSDDQETPDSLVTTYEFGDKMLTWEGRSCQPRGFEDSQFGCAFYGDKGSLISDGDNYKIYDMKQKLVANVKGAGSDHPHLQNFLD